MADQRTTKNGEKSISRRQFQYRQISYRTFIPYFALDSKYLKSLLNGRGYAYELEEPVSAVTLSTSAPSINSPDSGIQKPSFFIECELQVRKLFAFMELHLSKVEDDLAVTVKNVRLASSKGKQKMKESGMEESYGIEDDQTSTSMNRLREVLLSLQNSLNSSFAALHELAALHDDNALTYDGQGYLKKIEPKRKEFEGRINACLGKIESELHTLHRKNEVSVDGLGRFQQKMKESGMEESYGIEDDQTSTSMNRLREVLLSLQNSLNSSFAALHELAALHDDNALTYDGQGYLKKIEPKRKEFEGRINACLGKIESELHTLHRKNEVSVDGLGRFHVESAVTAQVRKSSFGCITFLYVLLFLVICGVVCYMYFFSEHWVIYLRLVRSPLLIIFYLFLFGFNMKGWANARIDYVTIFGYFPNGIPTPKFVHEVAGMFTIFFGVLVVALLCASPFFSNIPAKLIAMVMWLSLLGFLINPLNVYLRRGRASLLFTMVRILLAPFSFVSFGDVWFAGQLNSTVAILLDMQYYLCYIISDPWKEGSNEEICTGSGNGIRPILSCLPALWRFFQCLRLFYDTKQVRHLMHSGKYSTTFPIVVFATLFAVKVTPNFSVFSLDLQDVGWIIVCWLVSLFVHALYTFVWDAYFDWGLLQLSKGTLLRPKRLFRSKCLYVLAIVFNLILRFTWTLELTLGIVYHLNADLLFTGLVVAEILRRFVWNVFRVEYEQILRTEDH